MIIHTVYYYVHKWETIKLYIHIDYYNGQYCFDNDKVLYVNVFLKKSYIHKKNNSLHNIRLKKKCSFNVKYNGHYKNIVSDSGRKPANLELGENL